MNDEAGTEVLARMAKEIEAQQAIRNRQPFIAFGMLASCRHLPGETILFMVASFQW
jgi:hypothetical protein